MARHRGWARWAPLLRALTRFRRGKRGRSRGRRFSFAAPGKRQISQSICNWRQNLPSCRERAACLARVVDATNRGSPSVGRGGKAGAHQPAVPPKVLPGFPGATLSRPKAKRGQKPRTRWTLPDGTFLEFDSRHGTVEKYDEHGRHQGEFSIEGVELKPANPNYTAVP
jgi:hypothetical protein